MIKISLYVFVWTFLFNSNIHNQALSQLLWYVIKYFQIHRSFCQLPEMTPSADLSHPPSVLCRNRENVIDYSITLTNVIITFQLPLKAKTYINSIKIRFNIFIYQVITCFCKVYHSSRFHFIAHIIIIIFKMSMILFMQSS